ncbi:MAG: DUF6263 family protein [Bacteroidota bacterium]
MKKLSFILPLLFIASFFIPACKPGEIELRLKPQNNSNYRMVFKTDGNVSMNMAGKDLGTDVHTSIASILNVETLPGNRYGFALTYDEYDMAQSVDGKQLNVIDLPADSSSNKDQILKFIKGVTFKTVMSAVGKSEQILGADSIINKMENAMAGMPEETRKMLLTALKPVLTSDMAKGMLEQCFYVFPDEKVNIGDSWKNEIVMQNMFSMIIKSTYTLLDIQNGIARLKVHSEIRPGNTDVMMPGLAMAAPKGTDHPQDMGGLDLMGMKMKAAFSGTQDGMVWIDMNEGMVQKNTLDQDLTGKISISILDLPMTMKMKTSYEVSPK